MHGALVGGLFTAASALAQQQQLGIAVERLRLDGNAVRAIVRITNTTGRAFADVSIQCAFLVGGKAVDTGNDIVKNLAAGETAYANVIGPIGQDARTVEEARCRISRAK